MTPKLLVQWTVAVLSVPVVCVATYKIAASSTSISVPKLPPPAVVVTPSPTPSEEPPEPTPTPTPKPVAKPTAKPTPTPVVTPTAAATPTVSPTAAPSPTLPVPVPTAVSLVVRRGSAHLVYVYRSSIGKGPRPTSCATWEPVLAARGDTEGKTRRAVITKANLSFPGDLNPSSPAVSSFVCDWDFLVSVPQGQGYSVSVAMAPRPLYAVQLASSAPWAFSAGTLSPQLPLVQVLVVPIR
jgi:hypothetical protein